eukprot:gb/GFBE01050392.1/.p1 GENE.gb/GFBE01050392.1/~~gb/GFBE01050392.1/.p1  ORF type:complete len:131 (+),score=18.99 gb/GFBE01050392.1/:1-393(+)
MGRRGGLGLSAAFRSGVASTQHEGIGPFYWHGVRRTAESSEKGYERLVLPGTLEQAHRRALRSLAAAAGLSCETFGPKACRRITLALPAECSCCVNALSFAADACLTASELRNALEEAFGLQPLTDEDIT